MSPTVRNARIRTAQWRNSDHFWELKLPPHFARTTPPPIKLKKDVEWSHHGVRRDDKTEFARFIFAFCIHTARHVVGWRNLFKETLRRRRRRATSSAEKKPVHVCVCWLRCEIKWLNIQCAPVVGIRCIHTRIRSQQAQRQMIRGGAHTDWETDVRSISILFSLWRAVWATRECTFSSRPFSIRKSRRIEPICPITGCGNCVSSQFSPLRRRLIALDQLAFALSPIGSSGFGCLRRLEAEHRLTTLQSSESCKARNHKLPLKINKI